MPDSSDGADDARPAVDPPSPGVDPATPDPVPRSPGQDAVHAAKVDLRARLLRHRRALPAARRATDDERVQAALTELVHRIRPTRMTGYVPVGTEPGGADLPDVLRAALAPLGVLLLPVLCPDLDLDWAAYPDRLAPPDRSAEGARRGGRPGGPAVPLVPAGRGLREPVGPRLGPAAIAAAELVVVPAVAVDGRGFRLGRGGGSYDRALARVGVGVPVVALLHDGELVDTVPAEPHDRPVTAVITPSLGFRQLHQEPDAGS